MKPLLIFITFLLLASTSCKPDPYEDLGEGLFAEIQTNQGDMTLKLEQEKTPVTVANFVALAEGNNPFVSDAYKGKPFYDNLIFHRVIKDFMIQGGDPLGTGSGSPGYKFKDEIHEELKHDKRGILSMANSGPKTNGSQFFITHKATPWLDGRHTVFGKMTKGLVTLNTIARVEIEEQNRPKEDVVIERINIIRRGEAAENFDAVQIMTDYFSEASIAAKALKEFKAKWVAEWQRQKAKAKTTASGLKIFPLVRGTGIKPKQGQKVLVNYTGWLPNADLFDSSYEKIAAKFDKLDIQRKQQGGYAPFPMDYSSDAPLIPGFKEGLQTMNVGDKVRLFVPSYLAYGEQGAGPIPPNSDLVFDVEIVSIQQ